MQRRAVLRVDRGLWWIGVLGVALFVLDVAAMHALRASLDPTRHQISEYANGDLGALMVGGFVAWAVSLSAMALLLRARASAVLAMLVSVAGLGLILVAAWATQTVAGELPPGAQRTTAGRLHDLGAGTTSLALLLAAAVSYRWLAERAVRRAVLTLLLVAVTLDGILLAVGPEVGGLRQRILVAAGCGWQLTMLAACRPERSTQRFTARHPPDGLTRDLR